MIECIGLMETEHASELSEHGKLLKDLRALGYLKVRAAHAASASNYGYFIYTDSRGTYHYPQNREKEYKYAVI